MFSPTSVQLALAMSYAGAAGDTQQEMAQAADLSSDPRVTTRAVSDLLSQWNAFAGADKVRMSTEQRFANALFYREGLSLLKPYRDLVIGQYNARVLAMDFSRPSETCRSVNAWVEEATSGSIRELLKEDAVPQNDTGLVLLNALFFKARWKKIFGVPSQGRFTLGNDNTIQVPMMEREEPTRYVARRDVRVLELEYSSEGYSLVILVPPEEERLEALEARLDPERLVSWTAFLPDGLVRTVLPPFKIGPSTQKLKVHLQALGMRLAFDARRADFTQMLQASDKRAYVDEVHHASFIEVDRFGTTASAATGQVLFVASAKRPTFIVDRPFLFIVRDNRSGLILFMGRVTDPRA